MKFTYRLKSYFFSKKEEKNKRGNNLVNGSRPDEQLFLDWVNSSVFKSEPDDKAKEDVEGANLADINGHVVLATNNQAKTGASQVKNKSRVVQPHQLPTLSENSDTTLSYGKTEVQGTEVVPKNVTYSGPTLAIETTSNVRNSYLIKWTSGVIDFLNGMGASLKDLATRVLANAALSKLNAEAIQGIKTDLGGNYDQLLPVGATTFSIGVGVRSSDPWQPMDGENGEALRESSLGVPSTIYNMFNTAGYNLSVDGPSGPTHFLLPSMNLRIPIGKGAGSLGNSGTDWRTKIVEGNLPAHSHVVNGTIDPEPGNPKGAHNHGLPTSNKGGDNKSRVAQGSYNASSYDSISTGDLGRGNGSHNHTFAGNTDTFGAQNQAPITINPPTFGGTWYVKVI